MAWEPTQEVIDLFKPLVAKAMEDIGKLDQAVQDKMNEHQAKGTQPEDLVELEATFKAADTNGDGLLNEAEFLDYSQKQSQNEQAKYGGTVPYDEASCKLWYAAVNKFSPDVDGVSQDDIHPKIETVWMKCMS